MSEPLPYPEAADPLESHETLRLRCRVLARELEHTRRACAEHRLEAYRLERVCEKMRALNAHVYARATAEVMADDRHHAHRHRPA